MSDELQPPTQSEMIRQTHQMVGDLHKTIYGGNGALGLKTKVDRLWTSAKGLLYLVGLAVAALLNFHGKSK